MGGLRLHTSGSSCCALAAKSMGGASLVWTVSISTWYKVSAAALEVADVGCLLGNEVEVTNVMG